MGNLHQLGARRCVVGNEVEIGRRRHLVGNEAEIGSGLASKIAGNIGAILVGVGIVGVVGFGFWKLGSHWKW